jgi:hypothetical protein
LLFVGSGPNYVIVGSRGDLDIRAIEARFDDDPPVRADLRPFGINSPARLLARVTMGPAALRREFGREPLVSDQGNDFTRMFHDPARPSVIV